MLKKYLCGVAALAALSAPLSAEELYVRNRAFGDAYFVGGTTYVPVSSFLKALDVSWADNGSTVSLGGGDSPDTAFDGEAITLTQGDKTLDLTGMVRGGKLYVPAKNLASFVGYTVIHNNDTGIVDVVKTREITAADLAAEQEVVAATQAQKDARKAERDARKAKEKAAADAKAKAADEADGEAEEAEEETEGEETAAASKPTETAPSDETEAGEEEKPKEPAKANLVVLSSEASPNYYTGEVVIRAVVQNQGFAPAEKITAAFSVVGPDGRTWISKTLYRGPLSVDGRWEITENYKHREGAAMPRGNFTVNVTPKFSSAAVPATK